MKGTRGGKALRGHLAWKIERSVREGAPNWVSNFYNSGLGYGLLGWDFLLFAVALLLLFN